MFDCLRHTKKPFENNNIDPRIVNDGLGVHHVVMGSDPGSTDGHAFAVDKPDQTPKAKAQWSEHVWSKFMIFLPKFFDFGSILI
jgi:hypothetical protein